MSTPHEVHKLSIAPPDAKGDVVKNREPSVWIASSPVDSIDHSAGRADRATPPPEPRAQAKPTVVVAPSDSPLRRTGTGDASGSPSPAAQSDSKRIDSDVTEASTTGARLSHAATKESVQNTASAQSNYAKPVPGKPGFVYPPGVTEELKNMLDVRGLNHGQKVRDPRTDKIFILP